MITPEMEKQGFEAIGFYVIDSFKLDDLINASFPLWTHGSFLSAMECSNDTVHRISVTGELADYDREDLEKLEAGGEAEWDTPELLMNSMCATGKLPAGNYLVEVCW